MGPSPESSAVETRRRVTPRAAGGAVGGAVAPSRQQRRAFHLLSWLNRQESREGPRWAPARTQHRMWVSIAERMAEAQKGAGQETWGGVLIWASLSQQCGDRLAQPRCPLEGPPRCLCLRGQEAPEVRPRWARSRLLCLGLKPPAGCPPQGGGQTMGYPYWALGAPPPLLLPRPWLVPLFPKSCQRCQTLPGGKRVASHQAPERRTPAGGSPRTPCPGRPCSWAAAPGAPP